MVSKFKIGHIDHTKTVFWLQLFFRLGPGAHEVKLPGNWSGSPGAPVHLFRAGFQVLALLNFASAIEATAPNIARLCLSVSTSSLTRTHVSLGVVFPANTPCPSIWFPMKPQVCSHLQRTGKDVGIVAVTDSSKWEFPKCI